MEILVPVLNLFLIIIIGYLLVKTNVLKYEDKDVLTKINLLVAVPALTIFSMTNTNDMSSKDAINLILFSFIYYLIVIIIAFIYTFISREDKETKGLTRFMIIFSNTGFMGYPVCVAILGVDALAYLVMFNFSFNLFINTIGIILLADSEESIIDKLIDSFKSIPFIATIIGLILFLIGYTFPPFINDSLDILASLTTPLSMITIGIVLSNISFKKIFSNISLYIISIIKLIIIPLITYYLMISIGFREEVIYPVIIGISMPVAANTISYANQYNNDVDKASEGILISTLMLLITLPLVIMIIGI